jgi:hypothetical protein
VQSDRAGAARLRWVLAFAILLATLSGAPVFADEAPSGPPSLPSADTHADASELPTQAQIAQGLARVEAEEKAREEWLAGPRAQRERSRSALAYAELTAAEAQALLASRFDEELEALNADPARALSESSLDRVLAPNVATVTGDGRTALLDSTVPVLTENEAGRMAKVDLSLQRVPGGFEPENPLVPLSIPSEAGEAIEIGPAGLGVTQAGAEESVGRRFDGDNVFYPEVQPDTDLLISPVSGGVELFDQLRSSESPEVLRFDLDLPEGGALRETESGGAEVVDSNGEQLAEVPAPGAVDAQGTEVPVALGVDGHSLAIRVPHGEEGRYSYPILLDPEIEENWLTPSWFNGAGLSVLTDGTWTPFSATGGVTLSTTPISHKFGGSERGLFVSIPKGKNVAANLDGHWGYGVPKPNSFISRATLSPFMREDGGCNSSQPHDYDGLWDGSKFVQLNRNDAEKGSSQLFTSVTGRSLLFGLDSGPQPLELSCNRDLYLGGIAIWLEDPDQPSLSTTPSAEWMDNVAIRQAVSATDGGLGVKRFETEAIDVADAPTWETVNPCTGLHPAPCPNTWDLSDPAQPPLFFEPSVLPEGIDQLRITAYDVTEHPSATSNTITVRVDHAPPELTVSGTLTEQAALGTMRPRYTIKAVAKDGVPGSANPAEARSGVRSLEFFEDGTEIEPGRAQPQCTGTQSCSAAREYEIPTLSSSVGHHVVTVVAEDTFGHKATREIPFEIARDNRPPTLSVRNLPANGVLGGEPEILASAADEDTGVASLALQLDGRTIEEARQPPCPKGGCGLEHKFTPDLSGLPSGTHALTVRAEDRLGNLETLSATELIDNTRPLLALSGSLADSADGPLRAKSADLAIAARDPKPGAGIASIDVELDESEVSGYPVRCSEKCASFKANYKYIAALADPGEHTVSVEVADRAGNITRRALAVNVPMRADGTPACSLETKELAAAGVLGGPQATQQLTEALPQSVARSRGARDEVNGDYRGPTLRADGDEFEALESRTASEISAAPDGAVKLNHVACLTLGETTGAATAAEVVNEDSLVYANTGPEADTLIRPTTTGVMMVSDLRGPEAPDTYSWNLTVNEDEKVVRLPSGDVAIVEPGLGGEGPEPDPPDVPDNLEDPRGLANAQVQRNVGEYELAKAQSETNAEVLAVLPEPWILLSDESVIPATITVAPVLLEPNEFVVIVHLPPQKVRKGAHPVQVIADFSRGPTDFFDCPHGTDVCKSWTDEDRGQASVYAEKWSLKKKFNPAYWPIEENCTNFVSQAWHKGGQEFMDEYSRDPEFRWWANKEVESHWQMENANYTWSNIEGFRNQQTRSHRARNLGKLPAADWKVGDVILLNWLKLPEGHDEVPNHALIVTRLEGKEPPYIASETAARHHVSWHEEWAEFIPNFFNKDNHKEEFPYGWTWEVIRPLYRASNLG